MEKYEEKQKLTCFMKKVNQDFCPLPTTKKSLREKFIYFYRPYSFEANTKLGLEYDQDVDWGKESDLNKLL